MTGSSDVSGYIRPTSTPLMGQSLNRVIQQHIVGLTGLPGKLVTLRTQTTPPVIPETGCWCAYGIRSVPSDFNGVQQMLADGSFKVTRHETLSVLCSFYDDGANGLATQYASLLRDGLQIGQNNSMLKQHMISAIGSSDITPVPVLLNERWLYRVDIELDFRRALVWSYDVKAFASAKVDLQCEDAAGKIYFETITVQSP